ncbi:MAG: hypothetical protein QM726_11685 [Chitinophagaceae bacterium]
MHVYTFNKEAFGWYIDLPEFIEQGGSKGDLAMVEGADTMLDKMANGNDAIRLAFDDKHFEGSDKMVLTEKCNPDKGGGIYRMEAWEGQSYHHSLWLCAVTEFVFGSLPETIFVKRAN